MNECLADSDCVDSKLGKMMQRVGGLVGSQKMVEKGTAKREGGGVDDGRDAGAVAAN